MSPQHTHTRWDWHLCGDPDVSTAPARNLIHGSDTLENAKVEIELWFKPEEMVAYTPCAQAWLYE